MAALQGKIAAIVLFGAKEGGCIIGTDSGFTMGLALLQRLHCRSVACSGHVDSLCCWTVEPVYGDRLWGSSNSPL